MQKCRLEIFKDEKLEFQFEKVTFQINAWVLRILFLKFLLGCMPIASFEKKH